MNKETIKLTTSFNKQNVPKVFRNNIHWAEEDFPNSIYLDYSFSPPKKTEHICIYGKNLLSDNDNFFEQNKIFKTFNNIEINHFNLIIWEDNYLNLKKKLLNPSHKSPTYATRGIGILEVMYDEDHLYDHEGSGSIREETECAEEDEFVHLINFNLLVDTEDFSLISKKIGEDKKFNFELNIDIQKSSIVKHDKYKSTGITNADIIDYKLLL